MSNHGSAAGCGGLDLQKSNANGRFFIDLTIRWHGHEWLFWGRASPFLGEGGNVGNPARLSRCRIFRRRSPH